MFDGIAVYFFSVMGRTRQKSVKGPFGVVGYRVRIKRGFAVRSRLVMVAGLFLRWSGCWHCGRWIVPAGSGGGSVRGR